MSLENSTSKVVYQGNGSTKVFSFSFKVWEPSQVRVMLADSEGSETDVTSQVTVSVSATGGTVTFGMAPAEGTTLAILRSMPFVQEDVYITGSRFDPHEIEEALDIACAERQELREELQRSVKLPATDKRTSEQYAQELIEGKSEAQRWAEYAEKQADRTVRIPSETEVLASGSTTARTLAERFADIVNVKDFGAKGDGVTFDQEAFDAAIQSGVKTIHIPDGTYIINGLFVNRPVNLVASDGAIIKRESWNRTYYTDKGMYLDEQKSYGIQARSGLVNLFPGASGTTIRGGTWDMNAWEHIDEYNVNDVKAIAELDPNYDFQCVIFSRYATDLTIEDVTLRGATSRALNLQNCDRSVVRNIRMLDSEGGFQIHLGKYLFIENLYCERISNRIRRTSDSEDWKTGTNYLITYQHNSVLRQTDYSTVRGLIFNGYAPLEGTGTEPNPCMLTLERPAHSTFSDIVMQGRVNVEGVISVGLSVIGTHDVIISGLDIHDHVMAIDLEGCVDTQLNGFHVDNNWYEGPYATACKGLQVGNGAWAQHGNDSSVDMFMASQSRNVQVSNGEIQNAYVGVELAASNAVFHNVLVRGCYVGWNLLEVKEFGQTLQSVNNRLINCTASYCGKTGMQMNAHKNVVVSQCEVFGNGWDTSLASADRVGIKIFGETEYCKVTNCALYNEQPMTKDKGFSFGAGSPVVIEYGANRYPYRFSFVSPDPTNYQVGQPVFAKGLYGGENLYCHVLNVLHDSVTVGWTQELPSNQLTPPVDSLIALTGSVAVDAAAKTVTGTGTAFTSEIVGTTYIKLGDEYHLVAKVVSDTSLVLSTKPKQNYSGIKAYLVQVRTFRQNVFQQFGIHVGNTGSRAVYYKDNVEYDNEVGPVGLMNNSSFCADSEFKKASPVQDFTNQKAPYLSVVQPYDVPQYWKVKVVEKVEGVDHLEVRFQVGNDYTTLAESISTAAGTVAGGILPNVPQAGVYYLQVVARDSANATVTAASGKVYGYVKVRRSVPNEFFE